MARGWVTSLQRRCSSGFPGFIDRLRNVLGPLSLPFLPSSLPPKREQDCRVESQGLAVSRIPDSTRVMPPLARGLANYLPRSSLTAGKPLSAGGNRAERFLSRRKDALAGGGHLPRGQGPGITPRAMLRPWSTPRQVLVRTEESGGKRKPETPIQPRTREAEGPEGPGRRLSQMDFSDEERKGVWWLARHPRSPYTDKALRHCSQGWYGSCFLPRGS